MILGIARSISKHIFELDTNEAEFGKHLNFFYLLAILNTLSLFIQSSYDFSIGFILCLLHETGLYILGIKDIIYKSERYNLILANLEGIVFIFAETGIFLMASGVSKAYKKENNRKACILYNIFASIIFSITRLYSESSRRCHNLNFCMLIFVLHTTHGILLELLGSKYPGSFNLIHFSSRNLLFILILFNILTLINKMFVLPYFEINDSIVHCICIVNLVLVYLLLFHLLNLKFKIFHSPKNIK